MINRRRIVRSPRFETAPSFCLPPVDFCSGVSPSQAAKSRPAGNPSAAGTSAVIAVEGGNHYIETAWGRGYILRDPAATAATRTRPP